MKVVDLFAGIGGFSLGASAAGADVVLAQIPKSQRYTS